MEQCHQLMHAFQNEKTMCEYHAILRQFFNTIGISNEREMVNRLWTGLHIEIQIGLWQEHLHPEYSNYQEVLEATELIEIIENVSQNKHSSKGKGPNGSPPPGGNGKGGNDGPSKNGGQFKSKKNFNKQFNSSSQAGNSHDKPHGLSNGPSGSSSHVWNKGKPPPKRPELLEKEKAHRKMEGLCFWCGKNGHMSRQCPDGKTVKSEKNNSPPGFSNANMNVDVEGLQSLAETTEDLHELRVGMVEA